MQNNLRAMRKRAGLTQPQIAEKLGVSVPQVSRWETGKDNIPSGRLAFIADAYEGSIGDIFSDVVHVKIGPTFFVKGEVQAGVFKEAWELPQDEWSPYYGAELPTSNARRFGLRCVGNSMDLIYPPGTILDCLAYEGEEIPNGRRVIVTRTRVDETIEATVKELVRDADGTPWFVPRSTNPSFQAFRGDEPEDGILEVSILATVVGSYRLE